MSNRNSDSLKPSRSSTVHGGEDVTPDEEFEDVEFTPSEESPGRCKDCGRTFGEHLRDELRCYWTTKKIFTKSHYKKLEEAKYEPPAEEAREVIEEADPDTRLKLTIKTRGGLKVLDAFAIEDKEDLMEAFKKN
jgi:hypothetical protein